MRGNWLSNRFFRSYDYIRDHCCFACPNSRGSVTTEVWTRSNDADILRDQHQWIPDGFNAPGVYSNLLHEIGHAFGLFHPSDYGHRRPATQETPPIARTASITAS